MTVVSEARNKLFNDTWHADIDEDTQTRENSGSARGSAHNQDIVYGAPVEQQEVEEDSWSIKAVVDNANEANGTNVECEK